MLEPKIGEIDYSQGVYDPNKTLVILQREACFIDPTQSPFEFVATIELESCMALIITDEFCRTFFAHVDEVTELDQHFEQIKQFFHHSKGLTISTIGGNCDTLDNKMKNKGSEGIHRLMIGMTNLKLTENALKSLIKVNAFIDQLSRVFNIIQKQQDLPKFQSKLEYFGRRLIDKEFMYELKTKQFYEFKCKTITLAHSPCMMLRDLRAWMGTRYATLQIITDTTVMNFHTVPIIVDKQLLELMILLLKSGNTQSESAMMFKGLFKFGQYLSENFDLYNNQVFMDQILYLLSVNFDAYLFNEKSPGSDFVTALKSLSVEIGCYNKVHELVSTYKSHDIDTPTNTAYAKGKELRKCIYQAMKEYNSRKQEWVQIKESSKARALVLK